MTDKESQQNDGLDADLLEASFAVVAPEADRLVARFYEQLFDLYPEVQPLFADTDLQSQQQKLLAALQLVIANLRNTDVLIPALQAMGRRHKTCGAQPEHYQAAASVLLSVMAEIAGDQWTDSIQNAWCDALAVIVEVMIGTYSEENQAVAGPPGGVERRSANRPWTAPKIATNSGAESKLVAMPQHAIQR